MQQKLKSLKLNLKFPKKIQLIKSTMKEEGNASGYTRNNCIIINKPTSKLLAHELFHIFSRFNPSIRKHIYQSLDFQEITTKINYPDTIKNLKFQIRILLKQ